jgi:hypothetical protein
MNTRVAQHIRHLDAGRRAAPALRARQDVGKVSEPKAQALFETTAEVCLGLATAFEHYEQQSEPAWRR